MAGFVPLAGPRSWTPLGRALEIPPEAPPAELTPPPAPPPDPLLGLRQQLDQADKERAAEHKRKLAELRQAEEAARAEEARFAKLCGEVQALRERVFAELRAGAADLVVQTAARIAGDALRTEPELVDALVDEAVSALGEEGLTLRVCPHDEARLRLALADRKIQVVGDPNVRAGCIAASPVGRIDATLDTAVAALREAAGVWAR